MSCQIKVLLSREFCLTNLEELLINSNETPLVEAIVSVESEKALTLMSFIMEKGDHQSCIKISKETLLKWLSWRLWLHVPSRKHTNKDGGLPNQTVCRSIDGTKACRYFLWMCLREEKRMVLWTLGEARIFLPLLSCFKQNAQTKCSGWNFRNC